MANGEKDRSLRDAFGYDAELGEQGKKFEIVPGVSMRLRSTRSKKYRNTLKNLEMAYRTKRIAGDGQLDADDEEEFSAKLAANGVIVEWDGPRKSDIDESLTEADDGPLPHSQKNAVALMLKLPALRQNVHMLAAGDNHYRPERREAERDAIAKN